MYRKCGQNQKFKCQEMLLRIDNEKAERVVVVAVSGGYSIKMADQCSETRIKIGEQCFQGIID